MRIFSWNVNGIRAVLKKGALQDFMREQKPDVICLQETKAKQGQAEVDFEGYEEIWNSAERAGYSGTAIFSRQKPLSVRFGMFDAQNEAYEWVDAFGDARTEGRVLTAEYPDFSDIANIIKTQNPRLALRVLLLILILQLCLLL